MALTVSEGKSEPFRENRRTLFRVENRADIHFIYIQAEGLESAGRVLDTVEKIMSYETSAWISAGARRGTR